MRCLETHGRAFGFQNLAVIWHHHGNRSEISLDLTWKFKVRCLKIECQKHRDTRIDGKLRNAKGSILHTDAEPRFLTVPCNGATHWHATWHCRAFLFYHLKHSGAASVLINLIKYSDDVVAIIADKCCSFCVPNLFLTIERYIGK